MNSGCRTSTLVGGHCAKCSAPLHSGTLVHLTDKATEGQFGELVITPLLWCPQCCPVCAARREAA